MWRRPTPNGCIASLIHAHSGEDLRGAPGTGNLQFEIVPLAALRLSPDQASIISGTSPAFVYRADDYEVPLTRAELYRFLNHSLTHREYFAIRDHFGMAHEWHEDFYDPDTGEMFQPVLEDVDFDVLAAQHDAALGQDEQPGGKGPR